MYISGERSRERMMPVRSLCISIREKTIGGEQKRKRIEPGEGKTE